VSKSRIIKKNEQKALSAEEKEILKKVYSFFDKKNKSKHHFEGLASAVSCRVIGGNIKQGWVTQKSGDEGIDFVNRLDLGNGFSKTSIVVLGQAKCITTDSSVSASDLARVVARLQRGWIGVYVTTGAFSDNAQKELIDDNYPMILINGKRLAQEIIQMKNIEKISPKKLFEIHADWYENNMKPLSPNRIIDYDFPQEIVF
jgi:restriction endonuclease Mrr